MTSASNKKPGPPPSWENRTEVYDLDEFENERTWVFQSDIVPKETRLPSVMVERQSVPQMRVPSRVPSKVPTLVPQPHVVRPQLPAVEPDRARFSRPVADPPHAHRRSRTMLPPAIQYYPEPPASLAPSAMPAAPSEWKSRMAFIFGALCFVGALVFIMRSPSIRSVEVDSSTPVVSEKAAATQKPAEPSAGDMLASEAEPVETPAPAAAETPDPEAEFAADTPAHEPEASPVAKAPAKTKAKPAKKKRRRARARRRPARPAIRKLDSERATAVQSYAPSTAYAEVEPSIDPTTPAGSGRLNLISFPSGDVFLGPDHLGSTPLIGVVLPEGEHRLFVKSGELGQVVYVEIIAGEVTKHRVRWDETVE